MMLETRDLDEHLPFLEKVTMVQNVKYCIVAFLTFIIWDIIITFHNEVRYIWRLPRTSPTKWVFFLTRYFAVFSIIRTASLYIPLPLSCGAPDAAVCRTMFASQKTFSWILLLCAQALLMTRVYALYFCDKRVAIGLAILLVVQTPILPVVMRFSAPVEFTGMCISVYGEKESINFVLISVIPLIIILAFTITKYVMARNDGWGHLPMVDRLVKDDIALVVSLVCWIVLTVLVSNLSNPVHGYIALYWLIAFVPVSVCRIVIRMQRVGVEPQELPYSQRNAEFTSVLPDRISRT